MALSGFTGITVFFAPQKPIFEKLHSEPTGLGITLKPKLYTCMTNQTLENTYVYLYFYLHVEEDPR